MYRSRSDAPTVGDTAIHHGELNRRVANVIDVLVEEVSLEDDEIGLPTDLDGARNVFGANALGAKIRFGV